MSRFVFYTFWIVVALLVLYRWAAWVEENDRQADRVMVCMSQHLDLSFPERRKICESK